MNAGTLREELALIKDVEREIRERMSQNADVKNTSDIHGNRHDICSSYRSQDREHRAVQFCS